MMFLKISELINFYSYLQRTTSTLHNQQRKFHAMINMPCP